MAASLSIIVGFCWFGTLLDAAVTRLRKHSSQCSVRIRAIYSRWQPVTLSRHAGL
jgi:hypothetical protein